MDIKKLHILLAVARTGSFTGAAERVNLTQSAVSQQMALLEQDVKEPLFERGPRGVKLTTFALDLCEKAGPLLAGLTELDEAFRRKETRKNVLRVGAFPTAGIELIPKAIGIFKNADPDVRIVMCNINLESPEISLDTGQVDLILSFEYWSETRIFHPRIEKTELFEDPFLALVPGNHTLARRDSIDLAELAGERWIFHRHSNPYRNIYPLICSRAGFNPEVIFYADDFLTLQGLIAEEIGVSIAPQLSINPRRAGVTVLNINPQIARRISILTRSESDKSGNIGRFRHALEAASKAMSLNYP